MRRQTHHLKVFFQSELSPLSNLRLDLFLDSIQLITLINKSLDTDRNVPTFRHQLMESNGITLLLLHQNTRRFVASGHAPPLIYQQETRIESFHLIVFLVVLCDPRGKGMLSKSEKPIGYKCRYEKYKNTKLMRNRLRPVGCFFFLLKIPKTCEKTTRDSSNAKKKIFSCRR